MITASTNTGMWLEEKVGATWPITGYFLSPLRNNRMAPRGIARIAPQLRRAARCPRALHGGADPTGVQSCDLRQGARAACAADTASRARRRRLDGEPRHRGLGGGAKSVEGGFRMIVTLLIASLAVVLRIIRQEGWKRTR
jgi:hypothetical protein